MYSSSEPRTSGWGRFSGLPVGGARRPPSAPARPAGGPGPRVRVVTSRKPRGPSRGPAATVVVPTPTVVLPSEKIFLQTPGAAKTSCSGWERDPESFSKVIAEHYVRTKLGRELRGSPSWCRDDGKLCRVAFSDGIEVMVSLVNVPHYVIARQLGANKPRREYTYECTTSGRVALRPRSQ